MAAGLCRDRPEFWFYVVDSTVGRIARTRDDAAIDLRREAAPEGLAVHFTVMIGAGAAIEKYAASVVIY